MIYTNLFKKKENTNIIQTGECTGQATKTDMLLSYNKKEQGMYDFKNNSNMYSSLKFNIYSV